MGAKRLVDELFLGRDPLGEDAMRGVPEIEVDKGMTHVSARDIDMVLEVAPQPLTFWLELGAFEGGSAILAAQRVIVAHSAHAAAAADADARTVGSVTEATAYDTSVVAVDTFLGDKHVLWGSPPE